MPVDLKKLGRRRFPRRTGDPLQIWDQLDRAVGKEYLRPIQETVLKQNTKSRGHCPDQA
jgi:hypothetical protein